MRKTITRLLLLFLLGATFMTTNVRAQFVTVLPNDNSTSGNGRAPSVRYSHIRAVYLITPAEMAASGFAPATQVGGIGWTYQAAGAAGTAGLNVYLENTADVTNLKSTTWATTISTMTLAHSGSTTLGATTTPNVTFSGGSPFTYTGGGVYVAYDWNCFGGPCKQLLQYAIQQDWLVQQ
ncbi:MAG: hypothetical protein IPP71_08415 [Bacteroidetes bacterium]|nr:hypothetical protein [Bacteroidota bacterium]